MPVGKKESPPLRDQEREIRQKEDQGVAACSEATLDQLFEKYMSLRTDLRLSTVVNYRKAYRLHIQPVLGSRRVDQITYSDIKQLYVDIAPIGSSPTAIGKIDKILSPVFKMAVRDHIRSDNPVSGVAAEVKRQRKLEPVKREALTIDEQNRLLDYVSSSRYTTNTKLYLTVALGTGMRVGEILSLCWDDCDFANDVISVNKTLVYLSGADNTESGIGYHIHSTKTAAGTRMIPMLADVKTALLKEKERQEAFDLRSTELDGYSGFIFFTRNGRLIHTRDINRSLDRIIEGCNKKETVLAEKEGRKPILLPHISSHILRHTFCTRFCENETNVKAIQEIMGHSDISITMNVYNSATAEAKKASMASLEGKVRLV